MLKNAFVLFVITFYVTGCMVYIPGPNGSAGHYVDIGTEEQVKENLSDFASAAGTVAVTAGEVTKVAVESGALEQGINEYYQTKNQNDAATIAASSSLGVRAPANTGYVQQQNVEAVSQSNTAVMYETAQSHDTDAIEETTESPAQEAEAKRKGEAYCWKGSGSYDKKVYYRCYGPVQLLWTGYEELDEAILLSGCHGSEWKSSSDRLTQEGIHSGSWLICHDTYLKPYENSPEKISDWVNRQ